MLPPFFPKIKERGEKSGKVGNLVSGVLLQPIFPQPKKKFEMDARQEGVLESKGGLFKTPGSRDYNFWPP